jgi:hypothetical protein
LVPRSQVGKKRSRDPLRSNYGSIYGSIYESNYRSRRWLYETSSSSLKSLYLRKGEGGKVSEKVTENGDFGGHLRYPFHRTLTQAPGRFNPFSGPFAPE